MKSPKPKRKPNFQSGSVSEVKLPEVKHFVGQGWVTSKELYFANRFISKYLTN